MSDRTSIRFGTALDAELVSALCVRVATSTIVTDFEEAGRCSLLEGILGREAIQAELTDGSTDFLLLESDGTLQGVLARKLRTSTGRKSHVRHFYVEASGRGFGRQLWAVLREALLQDGISTVTVNSSLGAVDVYAKFGFKPIASEVCADGLTFRPMELALLSQVLSTSTFTSSRVVLRGYTPADAADLQRQADNVNIAQALRPIFPHPYTREDAERWIACTQGSAIWAIALQDGRVIGSIGLDPWDTRGWGLQKEQGDGFAFELGYWLGEEHWRQGYMSEAVGLLLARLQGKAGCIGARTAVGNVGSRRILEKAGFRQHRQLPEAEEPHGVCEDRRKLDVIDWLLVTG